MKVVRCLAAVALAAALPASAFVPPRVGGCEVFPRNNAWNMPVDTLQVHALSATWVGTIGAATNLHPDFGTFYLGAPIGIPFITVPGSQPRVPVSFTVPGESDAGPYPIPPAAPIEGGPGSTDDRHVLVVDRDNCVLYEMDAAYPVNNGASWTAFSGARWDLKANANRPDTYTSADAAGLPLLPGLVRYDEFVAGEINHAIRFTAPQTLNQHVWPATHDASSLTGAQYPPMGARFRLKASFDETPYAPQIRVVLRALKKYGMILADNGSPWYLSGEHNPAWDDNLLGQLKNLKGSDFEAVETAPLMMAFASTAAFRPPPAISLRLVANGLIQPTSVTSAHDGSNRLFVTEKAGPIRLLKNGVLSTFMDLTPKVTAPINTERGLLSVAFHPQYASNGRFYAAYTAAPDTNGNVRISQFTANPPGADTADPATEVPLLEIPHQAFSNHNGGQLQFGPDGFLWISSGDGGSGGDPPNNAQNLGVLLGKLLRIDVDVPDPVRGTPYSVPQDNPFVNRSGALPETWAYGLRNPWRFSFDRLNGDLYIGDVGQADVEEVDYVPAQTPPGMNFGWHVFEGLQCYPPGTTGCSLPGHFTPVITYLHSDPAGGSSVIGGYVYRGVKSAALRGYYIYGDFSNNVLWAATHEGPYWTHFVLSKPPNVLANAPAFGEDDAGEIYVANFDGTLYAIDGPAATADTPPPMVLQGQRKTDFNADARQDLAWQHGSGIAGAWLMNGATFAAAGAIGGPANATIRALADFDGDGRTDVLWRHADGAYSISLMDGLAVRSTTRILDPSAWEVVAVADFNGDGRADLLWRSNTNAYGTWMMSGALATSFGSILPPAAGWEAWAVADFSGDARADILWRRSDGAVAMTLVNGTVQGAPTQMQGYATGWTPTVVGDFNGDGRADLAWAHADSRQRLTLLNGPAIVGNNTTVPRPGWSISHAPDFNGDGTSDVVWSHVNGTYGAWIVSNGNALISFNLLTAAGSGWHIVGAADLDGDGKSDLLWRRDGGDYGLWLMDGANVKAYGALFAGGTRWELAP